MRAERTISRGVTGVRRTVRIIPAARYLGTSAHLGGNTDRLCEAESQGISAADSRSRNRFVLRRSVTRLVSRRRSGIAACRTRSTRLNASDSNPARPRRSGRSRRSNSLVRSAAVNCVCRAACYPATLSLWSARRWRDLIRARIFRFSTRGSEPQAHGNTMTRSLNATVTAFTGCWGINSSIRCLPSVGAPTDPAGRGGGQCICSCKRAA